MSRTVLPFSVGDFSTFARNLRQQLQAMDGVPGHVEMLNALSRSAGYRNFQHFRARTESLRALDPVRPAPLQVNEKRVRRVLRVFDHQGRLVRWPGKFTERLLCLWIMWTRIPARTSFTERQISELLDGEHLFSDHALLRRELCDRGMVDRTADGRQYRRLEKQPPADALVLMDLLRNRMS